MRPQVQPIFAHREKKLSAEVTMMRKFVVMLVLTVSLIYGARMFGQGSGHLYVINQASKSITLYDADSTTGELASVTTFKTPPVPMSLRFNTVGTYAYLTSGGQSPAITQYSVDAKGMLTQVGSITLNTGALPIAEIDPTGNYLLVTDVMNASLSSYHLNSNGTATAVNAATVPTLTTQMVFSPSAGVLYLAGANSSLTLFSFSSSSGTALSTGSMTLSPLGKRAAGAVGPVGKMISRDPSGRYLYVTDIVSGTVTGFSVNQMSGALTELPGAPYTMTNFTPTSPEFAASGAFLYFGNWRIGRIMGLKVNSDGSLSSLETAPTSTPFITKTSRGGNITLVADNSGKFLYAMSAETNQITGYQVDSTSGALTQIPGLLLSTGSMPVQAVFAP